MRSCVKAYSGLTIAAGIAYLLAIVLAISLGDLPDEYTLYDIVLDDYFMYIAFLAAGLLALAGAVAVMDGVKSSRFGVSIYGFGAILAAVFIACMHYIANDTTTSDGIDNIVLFLNLVFVSFGIFVIVKDSFNGFFGGALVATILTLVVDICYVMYFNDMNTYITGFVIGALIVVSGILCFPSEKSYESLEAKAAEKKEAAAKEAADQAAAKEEKVAAIKAENDAKYQERQAAKAAEGEAAAKKDAEAKPAAAKKEAAPAAEKKDAAPAQDRAAAAAAAAAAGAAAAEKKEAAPANAFDTVCKACDSRGLAYVVNHGKEQIPMAYPGKKVAVFVFDGQPDTSKDDKLEADGWTVVRFDGAEVTDGKKEAEVIADYLAAAPAAKSEEAPAEKAEAKEAPAAKAEEAKPAEAASDDAAKAAAAAAAAAAGAAVVAAASDEEEAAAGGDSLGFSNADLGIEPETVETPVRRSAYNMGLRFRRGYGPYKIPVAFVSCKVAVYVTDGKPDDANDAALEADGWSILRFDGADVTDGKKEAEIIADRVKEATRAQKAAAAKAKRAKARKAKKN